MQRRKRWDGNSTVTRPSADADSPLRHASTLQRKWVSGVIRKRGRRPRRGPLRLSEEKSFRACGLSFHREMKLANRRRQSRPGARQQRCRQAVASASLKTTSPVAPAPLGASAAGIKIASVNGYSSLKKMRMRRAAMDWLWANDRRSRTTSKGSISL